MKRGIAGAAALGVGLACLVSCSGASNGGTASGGTSSGSFPASSLAGTWDVVVGAGTSPAGTGTISIGQNTFLFDVTGFHLNLNLAAAAPDVTYTYTTYTTYHGPLTATHNGAALSLGVLPLDLGGTWSFAGQSQERCNGEAHPDTLSVTCSNIGPPIDLLRSNSGTGDGLTSAQRRTQLSSIFGDFGGTWTVVTPKATCDVTFQDNLFSASCSQGGSQGSLSLTFTDGLASGKTNAGGELSAKRR